MTVNSATLTPLSIVSNDTTPVKRYPTHKEHAEKCPRCDSGKWVRLHRSWWQKLFHKHQNLCICLQCRHEFWKHR